MHERRVSLCATAKRHVSSDTRLFNSKAEGYSNQPLSAAWVLMLRWFDVGRWFACRYLV